MTSLEKKGVNFSSLEAVSGKVDSHFREIFGFPAPRSA